MTRGDANATARGFIGIAFRVADDASRFECFYLRPTNGRAEDQLRRNHSTQYMAFPDFPWHKLRKESPGVYESYADMESAAWTKVRIVVAGSTARLYLHDASQPALIVNDLKRGAVEGRIALWAHVETEARFGTVTIVPR